MLRINAEKSIKLSPETNEQINLLLFKYLCLAYENQQDHKKITEFYAEKLKNLLKEYYPMKNYSKHLKSFLTETLKKDDVDLFLTVGIMRFMDQEKESLELLLIKDINEMKLSDRCAILLTNFKVVQEKSHHYDKQDVARMDAFHYRRGLPVLSAGVVSALGYGYVLLMASLAASKRDDMSEEESKENSAQAFKAWTGICLSLMGALSPYAYLAYQQLNDPSWSKIVRFLRDSNYEGDSKSLFELFSNFTITLDSTKDKKTDVDVQRLLTPVTEEIYQGQSPLTKHIQTQTSNVEVRNNSKEEITTIDDRYVNDSNNNNAKKDKAITVLPHEKYPWMTRKPASSPAVDLVKTEWTLWEGSTVTLNADNIFKYEPVTSKEKFKDDKYYIYIDIDYLKVPSEQQEEYTDMNNVRYLDSKDIWSIGTSLGYRITGVEVSHPDHDDMHLIVMCEFKKHDEYTKNLRNASGYKQELKDKATVLTLKATPSRGPGF